MIYVKFDIHTVAFVFAAVAIELCYYVYLAGV